tara:strand:- start:150 stop:533 length:384 start_codon:yes stop_codon:yes gene_type:complete
MLLKGWREKILTISIAIIFVLFIGYSIHTFLGGDKYREDYNINLFIVASISGIIGIVIGAFIKVEGVGAGLIGGGILSVLYGVIRYWEYAENIIRVIILGVVLGVLIWIGFKKFGNIEENFSKRPKK